MQHTKNTDQKTNKTQKSLVLGCRLDFLINRDDLLRD